MFGILLPESLFVVFMVNNVVEVIFFMRVHRRLAYKLINKYLESERLNIQWFLPHIT